MELLTVNETADMLRLSPITIRRYIAAGRLPAERVGRAIRIRREAIDDFIQPIRKRPPESTLRRNTTQQSAYQALEGIIGIGRSGQPTDISRFKDDYIVDSIVPPRE
jgi:excisionase family DNA binding protein